MSRLWTISFLLVSLFFLWIEGVCGDQSTPGYVFKNGAHIYKVVLEKYDQRTWLEAENICQEEENGHLVTLGDPIEQVWFKKLLVNLTEEMGYLGRFWIGATDKRLSGVYEYIDGSPFKYKEAPWAEGEPNRPKDVEYNYCIVMDTKGSSPKWSDEDCFASFGYVCKSKDAPRRLRAVQRFGYSWEWNYYDYKFVILPDDSMTWSEAEIYCQEAESGHLLSIYDSKESEWVTERIKQIRQVLGFQELWIGATDIFSKGRFTWTDDKPVNYTKWIKGNDSTQVVTKPREACVSILADPYWGDWSEEYCIKKLPFVCKTKKCQGKSDLAFIVDASGSVTEAGFEKAKNFMFQVIRGFQVKNNQTHIALVRFSDEADLIFGFKEHYGNYELKKAIDDMEFSKGETFTNKGLDLARTRVFSQSGKSRRLIPKIALVMTDGKSNNPFQTSLAAKKLKEEGVTIVTLGIGNGADRKELVSIASSVKDVLYVESYAALGAKVKDIRQRVCDEMIRVGLMQERIRIQEERQRLAFEAKQRLEVERRRKMSEKQKRIEDQKRRRIEEESKRRESERRNRYNQNNRNIQNRNQQNRNQYNRNQQNRNQQNRNQQNRNQYNRNQQNRNQYNRNQQNRNVQNRNQQNRNQYNRNQQNRNQYNRNQQNRNQYNRNQQNRNQYNRNQQNRNQYNRNQQNRNVQNRNQQNRNQYNRNQYNRNQQNRNQYNRNQQNRNQYNRNQQNRNQYNRNQQNRNQYNRNQQNRNQYNRNQYNRNQYNRNQYNRNQQNRYQG